MHPIFLQAFVDERMKQVSAVTLRGAHRRPEQPRRLPAGPIVLRLCRVQDDQALERLAQLEGRRLPKGSFVIAELDGSIVAALPLDGGAALADPFRATAEMLPLLELRAAQLASARQPRPTAGRRVLRRLASGGSG